MNVSKPVDYATMFAALDKFMSAELPQMKLYCEIGHVISHRLEIGWTQNVFGCTEVCLVKTGAIRKTMERSHSLSVNMPSSQLISALN